MEKYLISRLTKRIITEGDIDPDDYVGEEAEFNYKHTLKISAEEVEIPGGYALKSRNGEIIATLTYDEYYDGKYFYLNK